MFYVLVLTLAFSYCDCLTRYACLTQHGGGRVGLGSSEEFEGGNSLMRGSLSCLDKPFTKILVTRIIQGYGNYKGCSNPDQSCDKEIFSDFTIASQCDGRISCYVQMSAGWLEKCNIMSDFIHVEYECVLETSMFDICGETTRTVLDTSVYVVSPNVLQGPSPLTSWRVCECIVDSRYTEQIIADYIHSDIFASGNQCTGSHIMIESKLLPNQTTVDKAVEVCGHRTVSNQMFKGSIRFTFENRRGSMDDGFLTKFRVPPLDEGAEISMHCGPVKSGGTFTITNQQPIPAFSNGLLNRNLHRSPNGVIQSGEEGHGNGQPEQEDDLTGAINQGGTGFFNPSFPQSWNSQPKHVWNGQNTQNSPWQPSQSWSNTQQSVQVPRDPLASSNTAGQSIDTSGAHTTSAGSNQKERKPDFIPWTNPKSTKKDFIPWPPVSSKVPAVPPEGSSGIDVKLNANQNLLPAKQIGGNMESINGIQIERKLPAAVEFIGKGSKLAMTDQGEQHRKDDLPKGNVLAYIIGGAGAGLIGLCSVTLFFMYTRRRRQRRQNEPRTSQSKEPVDSEQAEGSVTYEDPTYVLPSDIADIPRVSQGHVNEAYEDEYQCVAECRSGSIKPTVVNEIKTQEIELKTSLPEIKASETSDTEDSPYDNNM